MKRTTLLCLVFSAALATGQVAPPQGYYTTLPTRTGPAAAQGFVVSPNPLPMFTYSVTASADKGGGTFTGKILGRSPFSHGKTTTSIPTQIIPLIITINDGSTTVTYDPTV